MSRVIPLAAAVVLAGLLWSVSAVAGGPAPAPPHGEIAIVIGSAAGQDPGSFPNVPI